MRSRWLVGWAAPPSQSPHSTSERPRPNSLSEPWWPSSSSERCVPWYVVDWPLLAFTTRPWIVGQYSCEAQLSQGRPGMWSATAGTAASSMSRADERAMRIVRVTDRTSESEQRGRVLTRAEMVDSDCVRMPRATAAAHPVRRRPRRNFGSGTTPRLKIVSPYVRSSRLGRSSSSWASERTPPRRPAACGGDGVTGLGRLGMTAPREAGRAPVLRSRRSICDAEPRGRLGGRRARLLVKGAHELAGRAVGDQLVRLAGPQVQRLRVALLAGARPQRRGDVVHRRVCVRRVLLVLAHERVDDPARAAAGERARDGGAPRAGERLAVHRRGGGLG